VAQLVSPPPASPYGPHGHHNPYASHNPYANPYGEAPQNINIYNAPQNGYYGPHYGFYPYKNKVVALLLCIFLGIAGFHRFYVGKIGTGLLYLFTGGFFLVGWLIDIILIVSGSFRDSHGYPLI
ncbi:TM2 domain-containing protein, partial [Tyzzerella sp. OttesenSCG-928-J15]|nr:TM2 domain-containing protein [Tyzzerella sp. OttesenSCG-928-J15]